MFGAFKVFGLSDWTEGDSINEITNRVEETSVENKILSSVFDHVMCKLPMEYSVNCFHHAVVFLSLKPGNQIETQNWESLASQ